MAEYTYDGTFLRDMTGKKLAEVDRSFIRGYNAALLGQIDRKNVRDPRGKKILEFDGKTVKDDLGKKVTTAKELQSIIEGEPDIGMVATWYFVIKKKQASMA